MLTPDERRILLQIADAEEATFGELVRIARLDPATAFRGADLRGVDFGGSDLGGFDFTEADLTGASFQGARIAGAIFDKTVGRRLAAAQRDAIGVVEAPMPPTQSSHSDAADVMLYALEERRRALALMPMGTGRKALLVNVISRSLRANMRAVLIVTTAAERDRMISLLQDAMPETSVLSTKQARAEHGWRGIVVHSASAYDADFRSLFEVSGPYFDIVYSTSMERLQRFLRAASDTSGHVAIVAVDTPLIDDGGPDVRRQSVLEHKLFGKASIRLEIGDAIRSGVLAQARIVQPFPQRIIPSQRGMFPAAFDPATSLDLLHGLEPITSDLVDAGRSVLLQPSLVLCRDASHAQAVQFLLERREDFGGEVRRTPQRWSADRIVRDLSSRGGVIIAHTSRQSIDAARQIDRVAVLTPLRLAAAQEIAFRSPKRFMPDRFPLVLDFADAFRGFPNVEIGLDRL